MLEVVSMSKVHTTKGLIDRDLLTVKDIVSEDENSRAVATEWFLDGELVRRDVTCRSCAVTRSPASKRR
jgi:hypothetical protein